MMRSQRCESPISLKTGLVTEKVTAYELSPVKIDTVTSIRSLRRLNEDIKDELHVTVSESGKHKRS